MVGILLVTHGPYATALIESVEMVYGKQEKIESVYLSQGESVEKLQDKINEAINTLNCEQVLIMVDILGGTPYTAGAIKLENPNINVITGINMPMLLEILPHRNEDLKVLSKIAAESGKNGIVDVKEKYEMINKNKLDNNSL
ncbi:PTS system, mannose-specific IIA component [Clostridium amylolyticum]|uniref:PTS system, mannose-specific IIA component n=1 Tax=Clostridium amylolyticum TaxID=1121298 RepID=A0A1M6GVQ9_9CLOT|nr:PTS sugar transporter subunit IIA [Clostridium amylolyticum]SHJ13960.1 PTS system, mannose-specific IIA component [Clostridium amylolyticum]